ncbi:hypothetical protein AB0M10_16155 [Streptomyces sp. NPDC051840]
MAAGPGRPLPTRLGVEPPGSVVGRAKIPVEGADEPGRQAAGVR